MHSGLACLGLLVATTAIVAAGDTQSRHSSGSSSDTESSSSKSGNTWGAPMEVGAEYIETGPEPSEGEASLVASRRWTHTVFSLRAWDCVASARCGLPCGRGKFTYF